MRKSVLWIVFAVVLVAVGGVVTFMFRFESEPDLDAMKSVGFLERRALVALAKTGKFARLDQVLTGLQTRYEKGQVSEYAVSNAFNAFHRADPELAEPLKRWREHSPQSFAPFLASGIYNVRLAWAVRGAEWSSLTSTGQMEAMDEFLEHGRIALRAAVQKNPRVPAAWDDLISIAMVTEDQAGRTRVYEEALRHVPHASSMVHSQYHYAIAPKWGGDATLQSKFRSALRLEFGDDKNFWWLTAYEKQEQIEYVLETKGEAKRALKLIDALLSERKTAWLYKHRGMALSSLERFEEAVDAYERAIDLSPGWVSLYKGMVRAQGRLHRPNEVQRYWKQALELDPYNPDLLVGYAGFLSGIMAQTEAAHAQLRKALLYGGDDDRLHIRMAEYYQTLRMPKRALEATKRAVELVPMRSGNWFTHGLALERTEDCKAIEAYERYLLLCEKEGCADSIASDVQRSVKRLKRDCQ